jgi:hypothetical protein
MQNQALDDATLQALSRNCGGYYLAGARATGKPWRMEEDPLLSDLGLPVAAPPNNATITREPEGPEGADRILGRALEFFSASPGGGFQLWSIWPSVDLGPFVLTADRRRAWSATRRANRLHLRRSSRSRRFTTTAASRRPGSS